MGRIRASVFVLMPFGDQFLDEVYELGVHQACVDAGAKCTRVDKVLIDGRITEEIYNLIDRADIVVADVTGSNANVFYEIGFTHGLGKNVILIKHIDDINYFPFDTHDFQHILYSTAEKLKVELVRRIERYSESPTLNLWNSAFHKKRLRRHIPNLYEGFTEAGSSIEKAIIPYLSSEDDVNIKMLGVALHKSWPLVSSLLEDNYLDKWEWPKLTIELAVIRQEWLEEKNDLIHSDWMARLMMFETHLEQFKIRAEKQINIKVYRFHHMPYLHGVLIDNCHLFQGNCSWDRHNKLTVGNNIYEEYSGEILACERKIEQFSRWFDYCKKEDEYYN